MKIRSLAEISLGVAMVSIGAQIVIPMPGGVPITLQTIVLGLIAVVLGPKKSMAVAGIYILVGLIGIPVFNSLRGGLEVIIGPTGGYLLSFPIFVFIIGYISSKFQSYKVIIGGALIATVLNLFLGTIYLTIILDLTLKKGLIAGFIPFVATGVLNSIVIGVLGLRIRNLMYKGPKES